MSDASDCSVCQLPVPVTIRISGQELTLSCQFDDYLCINSEDEQDIKSVGLIMTVNCYLKQNNYLTTT